VLKIQDTLLCFSRKWWRPFMLWGIGVGGAVNLILIPLKTGKPIEFDKAALWVGACGALSWVREWGKAKGTADK
jgi:hypothetical protein